MVSLKRFYIRCVGIAGRYTVSMKYKVYSSVIRPSLLQFLADLREFDGLTGLGHGIKP